MLGWSPMRFHSDPNSTLNSLTLFSKIWMIALAQGVHGLIPRDQKVHDKRSAAIACKHNMQIRTDTGRVASKPQPGSFCFLEDLPRNVRQTRDRPGGVHRYFCVRLDGGRRHHTIVLRHCHSTTSRKYRHLNFPSHR